MPSKTADHRRLGAIADLLEASRAAVRERDRIWLRRLKAGDGQSELARASRVKRSQVYKAQERAGSSQD